MKAARLEVGKSYKTRFGVLTYTGLYRVPGFYCDGCNRKRPAVHEFLKGVYPHHSEVHMYGTECVKKFVESRDE